MLSPSSAMTAALCDAWLVNATNNGSMGRVYHSLIDEADFACLTARP
jgi:hypothetical protein